jgi:ribosomal protein S18 acetylase RimI-like enzyme
VSAVAGDLALDTARLVAIGASAEHVDALQACLAAAPRYFRITERRAPAPDEAARLLADVEADPQRRLWAFAARGGGEVVALLDLHLDYPEPGTAHVGLLLVREALQGRGLGREIVERLEAALAARGFAALRLSVVDEDAGARAFWERLGFPVAGRPGGGVTVFEKPLGR